MITVRRYETSDWAAIEQVHDSARKIELRLAGLEDAFLPLAVAAPREGLLEYPGLFVAVEDCTVIGFAACTEDELAWLYVSPEHMRQGVGRRLAEYALRAFPGIRSIEVLKGNEPAMVLYERLGFSLARTEKGQMPGNEAFAVEVCCMERNAPSPLPSR